MATEKLIFKLELYATMWDQPPHAEILIGDKSHFKGDITGTEDNPNLIEFEHEFTEGEKGELIINRSGKTVPQTVINDNGDLLKDQLLHIKKIEVDEVDLGALVYEGVYTPQYPEPWATQQREAGTELPESFKNVTSMGHDGTWRFKFESPFYMWLLENLY
jgi:hypothetical protein|tara:strand:- start:21 stop:503 length:483 start_codon:yes stop_codon:yes gene_type:complete